MIRLSVGVVAMVAPFFAQAQTHVVKSQDNVVRAIAVYEWTGELAKPAASRLVPVSVFINRAFQDAGVYLARPVPFALETGTVFELERAGMDQGSLELAFARKLETAENVPGVRVDDGWFAYGAFRPKPAEKLVAAKKSGPLPVVVSSGGKEDRPHFSNRDSAATTPADRKDAAGAGTTVSASPAERTVDNDGVALKRTADSDSDSAKDDPERPTLKRRTPEERKATQKKNATASVVGNGNLNDDPDRPSLHRGKPAGRLDDDDVPALHGLPADMHQLVAVSDAKNRPEHEFARAWDSPEEKMHVMEEMRALAQAKVAGYGAVEKATAPSVSPARKAAGGKRRAAVAAVAPVLFDGKTEELKGYTLSYGGAATYVYAAATTGGVLVTVVAQREPDGSLKTALASVTDAGHLDRTPQLRLVDAVDPDASNRASLLFERRGATSRDFALYRVIGAQAEETIATGGGF